MKNAWRVGVAVWALSGVWATAAWAQAAVLRFEGALAAGTTRAHRLNVEAGSLVQGQLTGPRARLVLLDAQGHRVRVLSRGLLDADDFLFVTGANGPYSLEVRAPTAVSYKLDITRTVPLAQQVPPPPSAPDSPLLRRWQGARGDTAAFWAEVTQRSTPLVEDADVQPPLAPGERLVTFLWRGAQHNVKLLGGPSNDHDALHRLGQTDIWFRSYRVPDSTRLAYRLAPDVPDFDGTAQARRRAILATAQTDPLNPRTLPDKPLDRFNAESLLELPGATADGWSQTNPVVPKGELAAHRLASTHLGNERDIHLYRSHGYRAGAAGQGLLVLFDADRYLGPVPVPTILDNLVHAGRLPPMAAVFVANPTAQTRSVELPPNLRMSAFMAQELMPWLRSQGVEAEARRTVVAGASYGGLAAAWVAFQHPEWFGKVYSQSGSFWWSPVDRNEEPEWLTRQLALNPRVPVDFWLEAGRFETGRQSPGILDSNRHLRDVLQAKGYQVQHREHASGHDNAHWKASFGQGLADLMAKVP